MRCCSGMVKVTVHSDRFGDSIKGQGNMRSGREWMDGRLNIYKYLHVVNLGLFHSNTYS